MERDPNKLAETELDVLVIGGGITGAGVARDAALRGLRVGLVEMRDFGWGTTARSTRLAHGGLRYLEMFHFGLVRESLRERELLLKQAPHLVRPLPFLVPVYRTTRRGPLAIRLGMRIYDLLSYDKSLPTFRWYRRDELLRMEPNLTGSDLLGGALYFDAQIVLPERLCLENVQSAVHDGALVANYVAAEAIEVEEAPQDDASADQGRVHVMLRDLLSGDQFAVTARVVVNATGPWSDQLGVSGAPQLRTTKGAHLLVPKLTEHAIVMLAERDGRIFFVIPWQEYSLIGTTDTDFEGDPGTAKADEVDVRYLIEETRRYFPHATIDPVYVTMAGVRPLLKQEGVDHPSSVSREHKIVDSHPGASYGILSVLGGKLTTYRSMAAEAVDQLARKLGNNAPSRTRDLPVYGGDFASMDALVDALRKASGTLGLSEVTLRRIAQVYGSQGHRIVALCHKDPRLARPIVDGAPDILAQVVYGVQAEMVRRSSDFIMRRTGIGLGQGTGEAAYPAVAALLREHLRWDDEETAQDRQDFERHCELLAH